MPPLPPRVLRLLGALSGLAVLAGPARVAGQSAPAVSPIAAAAPALPPDEVVTLAAMQVGTAIGAYHEESSAMATKVPTSLKEIPSSLQVLNATAIADRNATSLQDVYSYIIGVDQSQVNTNGFTFRGFPNTGTFTQNIEYDGLQGGIFNHSATSAADVEDLEFLKGPNSVLYGQMHPGGLLNIVSKVPLATPAASFRTTVSTYAGRYNAFASTHSETGTLDATGPIDAKGHWLYRFVFDAEDNRLFRPGDYDRQFQFYPSLTYRWDAATILTAQISIGQDKRRFDDGILPIFTTGTAYGANARYTLPPLDTVYQDPSDWSRDRGEAFALHFQKHWAGSWAWQAQTRSVWHTDSVRDLDTNNTSIFSPKAAYATPGTTFARQYNHNSNGHRYNFFDVNAHGLVGPAAFAQTLVVGVGGGQEFYDNQRVAFGPNVTPALNPFNPVLGQSPYPADGTSEQSPRDTLDNLGEYATDRLALGPRLHVTLGSRHDQQESHGIDPFNPTRTPYIRQFVGSFTSQAGVVADLTPELAAYASWSQSVVPNVVTSIDQTGHAGFAPERGEQDEAGLKYESPARVFYASAAVFWIDRSNVLVTTGQTLPGTGQGIFRLDGAQHSEGGEFETEYQPFPFWQIQGGISLDKAFVAASLQNPQTVGLDLINAPRESGNLWSRFNLPAGFARGLGFGAGLIYTGKSWGGDPSSTVYYLVSAWARVDGAVYYRWSRYDLALNVQNLLDRQYLLSAQTATILIPGDVRKLTFSVSTRF